MLPLTAEAAASLFREDRRAHPRVFVGEPAELVIPVETLTMPCVLVNISAGGAKVACDAFPPVGTPVELRIADGRRIAAIAVWFSEGMLGLQFTPAGGTDD